MNRPSFRIEYIILLAKLWIALTIPFLILTFGTLFVFYRHFHPWKSEGISVGFTPGKETRKAMIENIYDEAETEHYTTSVSNNDPFHGLTKGTI